jgi:hypothetical protein
MAYAHPTCRGRRQDHRSRDTQDPARRPAENLASCTGSIALSDRRRSAVETVFQPDARALHLSPTLVVYAAAVSIAIVAAGINVAVDWKTPAPNERKRPGFRRFYVLKGVSFVIAVGACLAIHAAYPDFGSSGGFMAYVAVVITGFVSYVIATVAILAVLSTRLQDGDRKH